MYDPSKYAKQKHDLIWYAIDLDGTLADSIWPTEGIGVPLYDNVQKLKQVAQAGYKIAIFTSRPSSDHVNIENWLDDHDIPHHRIYTGKLLAKYYIDDRNKMPEEETWL